MSAEHSVHENRNLGDRAEETALDTPPSSHAVTYRERAAFYEVEYREDVDQAFLRSLVTDEVDSILEIPCGAGRNAGWLAETGRFVVCADVEPAMIEQLERRGRDLGIEDRIHATVADMRDLNLGRTFDLILVPREAFQLLTDDGEALRALKALCEHLTSNGTLLIDLCKFSTDDHGDRSTYPDYFDPKVEDGQLIFEWSRTLGSGEQLTRSRIQHREDGDVKIEYFYTITSRGEIVYRWDSEIWLRSYSYGGFAALLNKASLGICEAYRNYSMAPYTPGSSRIIALIERSNENGGDRDS